MRTSLIAIALAACSSQSTPMSSPDSRPPSPPDAAVPPVEIDAAVAPVYDPGQPGPYAVGVHTVELTDPSRNRTFSVEVWYPVDPAHVDGDDNTYSLLGGLVALPSPARRDATPAPGGPWPLVVFSHGYGGIRFQSFFLTEQLASHGFVVAAPDHPGNTLLDFGSLGDDAATAQSAMDRPVDVAFTADRAIAGELGVA